MRSLVLLAAALWAVGEAQSVLESRPLSSSRKFFKALSPRKRSSLAASSGCPSIGQPCATFPEEAFNCVFTTAAPSYCNITNTTADVATGTCTAPTAAKYISNVFGKSCTTLDDCEAFELEPSFYDPPLRCNQLYSDDAAPPGTCSFPSVAVSDPCTSDTDCSLSSVAPRCDLATHSCAAAAAAPIPTLCPLGRGCSDGYFCNTTQIPYTCNVTVPIGATCDVLGDDCGVGVLCVPALNGGGDWESGKGTCTRPNSLLVGTTFLAPTYSFYAAADYAASVCASGLGVPVANATSGYPTSVGRCVDALDATGVGQPCSKCAWSDAVAFSNLPVLGDGSTVCAPTNYSGTPACVQLPSSLYSTSKAVAFAQLVIPCLSIAKGPGGVACDLSSQSPASCWRLRCYGAIAQALDASGGLGASDVDPSWLKYVPESNDASGAPAGCVADGLKAQTSYLVNRAPGACPVPPAWAAVGWECATWPPPLVPPSNKLTPAAIVGVVIGIAFGAGILVAGAWVLWKGAGAGSSAAGAAAPLMGKIAGKAAGGQYAAL